MQFRPEQWLAALAVWALALAPAHGVQEAGPDAPGEAVPAPALSFSGSARLRYESLSAPFRAGLEGSDQFLSSQVFLRADARMGQVTGVVELIDARGALADGGSVVASSAVNALDIYQAYLDVPLGERANVRAGRFIMPIGSKRLADASSFSNVPDNFEGVQLHVSPGENWQFLGFITAPVERRPSDQASLRRNAHRFDRADWDTRFMGAHLTRTGLAENLNAEAYLFVLDRAGGTRLYTPGARLWREAAPGRADFEAELIGQTGHAMIAGLREDVRAASTHFAAGYTFDTRWTPRLSLQAGWASGDDGAGDGEWNRFNPLFGGRRSDFGHTGIFGPLSRENLVALGARMEVREGPVRAHLLVQDVRLASATDQWVRARLRDDTGASGRHVGQVIDARLQWRPLPERRLDIEFGTAALIKGRFARTAPGAPDTANALYGYLAVSTRF
ncbi:MAG: alginate export family protein [Glycocaulis sp.]